ncbi:MAG: ATPase [Candidatus Marinimicrobia bacterium]|nr:ATPase [Candidatus Neomarinimicrobiota bacterium]|tara:strand:- start:5071 stop:6807 length:1737 start_codon:yes stop_codon:yes gene_type:complete
MFSEQELKSKIKSINGRDYGACQSLKGEYEFPSGFKLIIHQIPKDPYAPPHTGVYRIIVKRSDERIINYNIKKKIELIAFSDFIARYFFDACKKVSKGFRGTGYSGIITVDQPGQSIIERNSVIIKKDSIEVRCFLGIPARGRKIISKLAEKMFINELPKIVDLSLFKKNIDTTILNKHVESAVDAEYLRNQLDSLDLVAFIANNAVLPRKSGISDKPMSKSEVIPFVSPSNLEIKINLPYAGWVKGMGISKGVTLITGGGYHGKSTLLNTLESCVYNHVFGDGREQCVTKSSTVKIRSYDGRNVVKTDISPFIKNLPFQKDTTSFSTTNASGSTSQAVNIIEAIEVGTEVLLMDEDTCATNFMIRDGKMQKLIKKEEEPITTFIDKVKQLYIEKNISTILVLGGVGDYFDVSDKVIQMMNYEPFDVTEKAKDIVDMFKVKRIIEDESYSFNIRERIPKSESIKPKNKNGKFRIYAKNIHCIQFGKYDIDLNDLEQIFELSQTKALGYALEYSRKYMDGIKTIREVVEKVMDDIEENGIDVINKRISGDFSCFRGLELAFTMNRLRSFDVSQKGSKYS